MAVNVTIAGNIYNIFETKYSGSEVAYQPYFYNAVGGGSSSIWGNVRTSILGQYNFNLADDDLLTTAGEISSGDVVLIVFWTPNSSDRLDNCSSLNSWSIFRIILGTGPGMVSESVYVNDVQLLSNICPNLNWSLQATGLVGTSVTATNSSTDQHQWVFSGVDLHHRNTWYGQTLMYINAVDNTDYDWGDSSQSNNLSGAANGSHIWSISGDYEVKIIIEDECGCTVTGTDQIRIYNRTPVPNIEMTPEFPTPNEDVTFKYTGTDLDNSITNISWTINDSGIYGNTNTVSTTNNKDATIYHTEGLGTDWYGQGQNFGAFTNPGDHNVSIVITWWDGFDYKTINYNETFTQTRFSGPVVDFTQNPLQAEKDIPVIFTNTSTNTDRVGLGLPLHHEYTWRWTDDTLIEIETDKPYAFSLEKTPNTGVCQVQLCAQWSDGWDTNNTCIEKNVVFKTTVTISEVECYYNLNLIGTSDDGSVTGYGWTVYSGSGEIGPWVEQWASPVDLNQNDKKICFTSTGWYKIKGAVYGTGNTTYDEEILEITEVCPPTPDPEIIPICPPDIYGKYSAPEKKIYVKEIKPSLRGRMDIQSSPRIIHDSRRPFPGPTNL